MLGGNIFLDILDLKQIATGIAVFVIVLLLLLVLFGFCVTFCNEGICVVSFGCFSCFSTIWFLLLLAAGFAFLIANNVLKAVLQEICTNSTNESLKAVREVFTDVYTEANSLFCSANCPCAATWTGFPATLTTDNSGNGVRSLQYCLPRI